MSVIEKIDNTILDLIEELMKEYKCTGLFSTPTPERKSEIIEEIAKLRASMEPKPDK